jgi:hypothetical protein
MIRPLEVFDLPLLHRVRHDALCLDAQRAFTHGPQAWQHILRDVITPGGSACTLVFRPNGKDEQGAVGQFLHRPDQAQARLIFLAPNSALSEPAAVELLEVLSQAAGERGAHSLIAEVDEENPVFISLRRAGFAVYARQRIWRLEGDAPSDLEAESSAWRISIPGDEAAARMLYHSLVPAMVQQVEPPPLRIGRSQVHWHRHEMHGLLDIERGPRGMWVEPFIHPAAEQVGGLMQAFIAQQGSGRDRPLYICVRSYQAWIGLQLEKLGFSPWSDQAVMVKRLASPLRVQASDSLSALDGTYPEPTAPVLRTEHRPPLSRARGGS